MIDQETLKRLNYLGIVDSTGTRDSNVGGSDYAEHLIQPWSIIQEYDLDYWDGDIIKRTLRTKEDKSMSPIEQRILDYKKIMHNCAEKIRQLST